LVFEPDDSVVERWRSVGYVAGTLADESLAAVSQTAPAGAMAPPKPAAPPPTPTVPHRPTLPPTFIDLQLAVGSAPSGWRMGGLLRGAHMLSGPFFGALGVRYAQQPEDSQGLRLEWFVPSVGGGLRASPFEAQLDLDFRVELVAELARARASDPETGHTQTRGRWAAGVLTGVDVGWRFAEWGELTVGGEVTHTGRPIEIRLHGRRAGAVSGTTGAVLAGFRATFR
jgi:hypothetical protein